MPTSSPSNGLQGRKDRRRTIRPYTMHFGPGVAPVRRALGPMVRRVNQISVAMQVASLADADLTPVEYGAMACLNAADGEPGIDQIGLAARLGIDRNSASVLAEGLAVKGLLERRINGDDRRARLLHLTSKGEKSFKQVRQKNLTAQALVLKPLMQHEQELLLDLLARLIAANGQHARPGAGRRKRGSQQSQTNKSNKKGRIPHQRT